MNYDGIFKILVNANKNNVYGMRYVISEVNKIIETNKSLQEENRLLKKENEKLLTHNVVLEECNITDPLTNALNLSGLKKSLMNINKEQAYIVCLDLDNFKYVNDYNGHHQGDETLKKVVTFIKSGIRAGDIVARTGGDEFVVILSGIAEELIKSRMELIKHKIEYIDLQLDNPAGLSISYGVAKLDDYEDSYKEADKKLYEMKRKNRSSRKRS